MREIRALLNEYDNLWFYVSEQYQDQFYNELKLMDAHFLNGSKLAPESIGDVVGVHSDCKIGRVSYFVWYNSFFSAFSPIKIDYEKFCVGRDDYLITDLNIFPAGAETLYLLFGEVSIKNIENINDEVSCFSEKMYVGIGFGVDCDSSIISMPPLEAKSYCRKHFREIQSVLDAYEINLFVKAMNSL